MLLRMHSHNVDRWPLTGGVAGEVRTALPNAPVVVGGVHCGSHCNSHCYAESAPVTVWTLGVVRLFPGTSLGGPSQPTDMHSSGRCAAHRLGGVAQEEGMLG